VQQVVQQVLVPTRQEQAQVLVQLPPQVQRQEQEQAQVLVQVLQQQQVQQLTLLQCSTS
jgi:hypothetical protein